MMCFHARPPTLKYVILLLVYHLQSLTAFTVISLYAEFPHFSDDGDG